MKVRTISDNQRSFAAQFSSSAAERGPEKPVSGSRWAPTPESSSDTNQSADSAREEALLTQGTGQLSGGRGKYVRPSGQPQDDEGGVSGDGSPGVQRVRGNDEAEGGKTKDKPKALGQPAVSRAMKSCRDSKTSGNERARPRTEKGSFTQKA